MVWIFFNHLNIFFVVWIFFSITFNEGGLQFNQASPFYEVAMEIFQRKRKGYEYNNQESQVAKEDKTST